MTTESYSISLFGLDPQYYTNAMIGDIWNVAANKIYEETGISITGEVHERYFVSPGSGGLNGSIIFMIESKKVPDEVVTDTDYWNAYRAVIQDVRGRLGNPGMSLTIEEIDITYFQAI
ncbi:MAG TPA: hypothetical protein DCX82_03550 [Lachnospiraceae bacterium]|jgi:hypothetical protein|nr:hypothetical protein [Lachnospiraceae bacterium]